MEQFQDWCSRISLAVGAAEPSLEFAHDGDRGGQPGYFSNQGRFVHFSLTHDGRVLASRLQAVTDFVESVGRIPRAPVLFPGGLAQMLAMNEEGAQLAQRAVTAWLLGQDTELDAIRAAFGRHNAEPLR